jgi:hypothetical protein
MRNVNEEMIKMMEGAAICCCHSIKKLKYGTPEANYSLFTIHFSL